MPHTRATPGWLARLGLHRPEPRAWVMYDWAISSVFAVIMSAVFPIYFVKVAGADLPESRATQYWSIANAVGSTVLAVLSPILGALADFAALKKRSMALCMTLGASATAAMFLIQRGDVWLASVLFVFALCGASGSMTFYLSLLPHVARDRAVDRVSAAGYAFGNVGGGLMLAVSLAWIQRPELFGSRTDDSTLPARLSFVGVAVWWVLFSLPTFLRIPEPPRLSGTEGHVGSNPVRAAFTRLGDTLRALRGYRQAALMLLAFMSYNAGSLTIVKMAAAYGTELGIGQGDLIAAVLLVYVVGIPFTLLFGMFAGRMGAKRSIFVGLLIYTGISLLGYVMKTAAHFYMLAILVGMVSGGTLALSRSLFSSMIPRNKSAEFFGFFGMCEKLSGIFGPLFFALAIGVTGSSRWAILSVSVFFGVGAVLLARVDVKAAHSASPASQGP
ncbi:UMF1 family MFS transporter [Archangium gephyra]|uniref:MDR-type permease n=2 Tax=Archangium gephyra TaxID=48 RepID=A0AAC8QBP2_9BACT|nr:MFS transporter [Archangium gephyra]AKJ04762.1 MDR-type permease [Archangium gephyra]REG37185.1 UMF1 family MFS transporter [Archangium gephyra]